MKNGVKWSFCSCFIEIRRLFVADCLAGGVTDSER